MGDDLMFAVCGLDCSVCDIYKATEDKSIAKRIANYFDEKRGEKIPLEKIACAGCRGDRDRHWSPDCWILKCCADEKGLERCNLCDDFPCEKLVDWSRTHQGYKKALERLKSL